MNVFDKETYDKILWWSYQHGLDVSLTRILSDHSIQPIRHKHTTGKEKRKKFNITMSHLRTDVGKLLSQHIETWLENTQHFTFAILSKICTQENNNNIIHKSQGLSGDTIYYREKGKNKLWQQASRSLIPAGLNTSSEQEIKMCLSNYSPTQKPKAHITVNSAHSFRQEGMFSEQSGLWWMSDLEEMCRKNTHWITGHFSFSESGGINGTAPKHTHKA